MKLLKKIWGAILDVLFPPLCLNCRKYLGEPEKPNLLCDSCSNSIIVNRSILKIRDPDFTLAAAGDYRNEALKNLIHYFKYQGFLSAAKPLGKIIISHLEKSGLTDEFDKDWLIIPMPLHRSRLRQRGFNQSEKLAEIISRRFNLRLEKNLLQRRKNTLPQITFKTDKERLENIKDAFSINEKWGEKIHGRNAIIVDDVFTSGATVSEAVKILRRAGARKIIALVAARA
jgi:ComF family protein